MVLQTENDSTADWIRSGWRLEPLNISVLAEEYSPLPLTVVELEELTFPAAFILVAPARPIDESTHQTLLDESLTSYEEIWRDLAQR